MKMEVLKFFSLQLWVSAMLFVHHFMAEEDMFPIYLSINVISAVIMLAVAVITGMLTTKIKTYETAKLESERERMRANLLRAVSHDLRTPLTSIYSATSVLREEKIR